MIQRWGYIISVMLILFASLSTTAQFKKINTIKGETNIKLVAVDRPGEFYVLLDNNSLQKYDSNGKLLNKTQLRNTPHIFDPRDGAKLFVFYGNTVEYNFLSHNLSATSEPTKVDPAFAINPFLACPAGDYNIIVLDSADWSFKKINLKTQSVIFESVLSKNISRKAQHITQLREYQNFIFLLDQEHGIHILNSIGKLLRTIDVSDISYFNFLGEELYYLSGGKLHFFNLFSTETRILNLPGPAAFALITDERLLLSNKNIVQIYSVKP